MPKKKKKDKQNKVVHPKNQDKKRSAKKKPPAIPPSKHEASLAHYVIVRGYRRRPIERVAPCIDAMNHKLQVVRMCCEALDCELLGLDGEEVYDGLSRIVYEIINEFDEAKEVLRDELSRLAPRL